MLNTPKHFGEPRRRHNGDNLDWYNGAPLFRPQGPESLAGLTKTQEQSLQVVGDPVFARLILPRDAEEYVRILDGICNDSWILRYEERIPLPDAVDEVVEGDDPAKPRDHGHLLVFICYVETYMMETPAAMREVATRWLCVGRVRSRQ